MGRKVILNLDESGNLGKKGRYFTIACIEMENTKPLQNIMKKTVLKTKKTFPYYKDYEEIKAADSTPVIKDYFLRKIISKEIKIRYIVADLHHVKKQLLDDENLLYNFMLSFIIIPIARDKDLENLIINLDKRTIKVKSTNSFADYIKLKLVYECDYNLEIEVNYYESNQSYPIQAADFIANAINSFYEYGNDYNFDLIKSKIIQHELFPKHKFGK